MNVSQEKAEQAPQDEIEVVGRASLQTVVCGLCYQLCGGGVKDSLGLKIGLWLPEDGRFSAIPSRLGRKDPPFLEPNPTDPANKAIWSTRAIVLMWPVVLVPEVSPAYSTMTSHLTLPGGLSPACRILAGFSLAHLAGIRKSR